MIRAKITLISASIITDPDRIHQIPVRVCFLPEKLFELFPLPERVKAAISLKRAFEIVDVCHGRIGHVLLTSDLVEQRKRQLVSFPYLTIASA